MQDELLPVVIKQPTRHKDGTSHRKGLVESGYSRVDEGKVPTGTGGMRRQIYQCDDPESRTEGESRCGLDPATGQLLGDSPVHLPSTSCPFVQMRCFGVVALCVLSFEEGLFVKLGRNH